MTIKNVEKRVSSLINVGRIDEAADLLLDTWQDEGNNLPEALAALVDQLSEKSPSAAYIKAFRLTERDRGEAERLFTFASTSNKSDVSAAACMALGGIHLEQGREDLALPFLVRSWEQKYPAAGYVLSLAYAQGRMGLVKDVDMAVTILRELVDEDDDPEAKLMLAQLIVAGKAKPADVDPFQLLTEAAAQGVEEAMAMLMDVGAVIGNNPDADDLMLPYIVTPDGMKRPKLIRDALVLEFDIRRIEAEEFTSHLFGYGEWATMMRDATDTTKKKGKFDEDLEPAELNERLRLLASVICSHVDMEDYVADIVVDLLKPTARSGRPSLKRLGERIDSCMVPIGSRTISQGMDRINDLVGSGGDFERAMRTSSPARPDVWIDMLESHLGWKFDITDIEADADGAWIGRVTSSDERTFEVFISRASLTPGDRGDEHVFQMRKDIEAKTRNAVLLFNKPLVHLPDPGKDAGVLFGGLLLDGGEWHEFVLRPGGGLDDAITQKLSIGEEMDPEVIAPFAFVGAGSLGRSIACYANDIDPAKETGYIPFGKINGWTNFVPPEMVEMMRNMKRRPDA